MRRRYQAYTLKDNAYGTAYPSPTEHTLDLSTLNGGLNLWELDYRLPPNQSPDLLNMYWRDGAIFSRYGQEYLYESEGMEDQYGKFLAGYERPWNGRWICHKGFRLYAVNYETGSHTAIYDDVLTPDGGTFFALKENLYYMNGHEYIKISESGGVISASPVEPYIPTVVLNRKPDGTGGDIYEDENRISAGKKVSFTADGTSTRYVLPYQNLDATAMTAVVNGADMIEGSGFTVDRVNGVVNFSTAPTQSSLPVVNNVTITVYQKDEDAEASVLNCRSVAAFGTGNSIVVVCGGTPKQPNAYFWSGNTAYGLDPTYFPYGYYNFAGVNDEFITGFGKQQNMLVIFKERSIGKTYFSSTDLNDLTNISLPYTPVNDVIGCSFGKSIQLVQNNLVFANKDGGVYVLLDTSSAGENNVLRISKNVNGSRANTGLLHYLRRSEDGEVCAYDDGERYWLCTQGMVYLWDYGIASFRTKEEKLSWFLFDNIYPVNWFATPGDLFYGRADGSLVKFTRTFSDFGEAYKRRYAFAVQHFGTYDKLKDVQRVIFATRSDTGCLINIKYKTDYEERDDLTLIDMRSYNLVPRDLSFRNFRFIKYAKTAVRIPRCFHIRHFSMLLYNDVANTDMGVVSAQIIFRYSRRDR